MNKKQNIQIAVIVLFFAAAVFVLYKGGLFGGGGSAAVAAPKTAAASQNILPNGDSLDFKSVINSSRFEYNILQYPQLSPQSDVGVPENTLIAPLPQANPSNP